MKKIIIALVIAFVMLLPQGKANAQILEIIKAAVVKVIKAVDLQIQRIQNKTIKLQNAQKVLENEMSKLKLKEISEWTEKQRKLYDDYYQELKKVKATIAYYNRLKEIISQQGQIVGEYQSAWALFKQDGHFTPEEISYMGKVYSGIFDQSVKNLDQIIMVSNSFTTQMSDGARLEIIDKAAGRIWDNISDLRQFTNQNKQLSLSRAKDLNDARTTKALYGLK